MQEPFALRYDADLSALGRFAPRFAPLARDTETEAWLARYGARPHGALATQLGSLLDSLLTSYDAHGLLGLYPMHLLSERAFHALLSGRRFAHLLDIGAGAGYVTEAARSSFERITCTETSRFLRRRLKRRGFAVSAGDLSQTDLGQRFDVVSCFNVLDRTARPLSLLRSAREHLTPDGMLVLSLPLPVSAHVHVPGGTVSPSERLPAGARSWEGALVELSEQLIEPAGLAIERIARVPYLSRGDAGQSMYALDAGLWLCRRR